MIDRKEREVEQSETSLSPDQSQSDASRGDNQVPEGVLMIRLIGRQPSTSETKHLVWKPNTIDAKKAFALSISSKFQLKTPKRRTHLVKKKQNKYSR